MQYYVQKGMTFPQYLNLLDDLLAIGKTTGFNQSDKMFNFGKLNRQRMKRLEKTIILDTSFKEFIRDQQVSWIWLTLTEGWCGDAAQNIPVIEKIAAENSRIKTLYLLRDENLELMDQFLTNGGRAIPKLICLDAKTFEIIGSWGARPQPAQSYFLSMKAQGLDKELMMENLQRWYLADKESSIQQEFRVLISKWAQS